MKTLFAAFCILASVSAHAGGFFGGAGGSTGASGVTGASGSNGSVGGSGSSGVTGASGADGSAGAVGQSGASGASGATGATGAIGSIGTIDGQASTANALTVVGSTLYAQSAGATNPGMESSAQYTLVNAATAAATASTLAERDGSANIAFNKITGNRSNVGGGFLDGTASVFQESVSGLSSFGYNVSYDGSNWKYLTTDGGALVQMAGSPDAFGFFIVPSGTGGTTATLTGSQEYFSINTTLNKSFVAFTSLGLGTFSGGITSPAGGVHNETFGSGSGGGLSAGTDNVFLGYNANNAGDPTYNVAIGSHALAVQSGGYSVGIGYQALKANTSGNSNVGIGYDAGLALTTGADNVYIGQSAGLTGNLSNNVGIGYNAMGSGTTCNQCTALGYEALYATSGSDNTALGDLAGHSATGSVSIFLGEQSGTSSTKSNTMYVGSATTGYAVNNWIASGTAPTITANCGTSPSVVGGDTSGRLNVGTGGTASTCTLTFATAFTNAPICVANDESAASPVAVQAVATTTTLVLTEAVAFAASSQITYICIGYKN